ncbi:MAG: redoxin domain-containing protein [candidate division Zixibacteria bacterium]|nr:redoxin domain-containing protein [candidate division Zixibacteria bacterium]MDH3935904.1 redoxin domain-containing protein [candidate division Zixibacteria bacterium]MDH4032490.1 redoxin domain-containing protein [candidate division Zixibacteria bacterium]
MLALICLFTAPAAAAFRHLTEGMDAPDFTGKDITSGQKIEFSRLIKSNLVIVVFWSTWSPRSLQQLTDLKAVLAKYEGHPVKVVAVNVNAPKLTPASRALIEKTVVDLNLPFDVIIDDGLKIFYSYGVIAVPSTAVVDTSGAIRYGPSGYSLATRDIIVDSIEMFLGLSQPDTVITFFRRYRPTRRATRYYNMAVNLKQRGMFERALSSLDSAQVSDANFAAVHSLRGQIYLHLDKLPEAAEAFEASIQLDSASVPTWAGWGQALLKSGQIEAAKEKLNMSLSIEDTYTPALMDLGLCWAETDSLDHAIENLERAAELNQMDPQIHYYLGRLYQKAGDSAKTIQSYVKALSIHYPGE